ncbi:glycosyltransferase family 4 protein [Pseudoalteromonas sp. SR43-7]|uniref:glycosyltransferase family 4 protein n=1 Tax=Pseudoalteromonas sp. SR43-7 TaxID=2760939 RepID=UPI0015FA450C|nr:glycosyltransferase family 4 protein [Pseudoalteromonas sp. SR43-7]MBB1328170.1 glycosyltransferase family 4 protein [Pseudoalteromonas sp. SR43-7]
MKIIAFVGETYEKFDKTFFAKPTSAAFLQDAIGKSNVYVCSPSYEVQLMPRNFSTEVDQSHFHSFPSYRSTKDFALKSLFKKGYLKSYQLAADNIISKHSGSYFWIRTPSIGSIIFGLRALKAGEKVLHHMCADASNTWKDGKYSAIEKVFGYLLSRFIRYKLSQICIHKNTINLCTGSTLEKFSNQYAPNNTYQFVDLMIKKPPINTSFNQGNTDVIKLLFIGRVVEDKGIFDLINSMSQLGGSVQLTVIGDGPDLEASKMLVDRLGISSSVFFKGQLPHSELASYLESTTLVVIPSNNYYEGFPRVIMEAWAYKKPVIVSKVGGVKAFVVHGDNGLIFEQGDSAGLLSTIELLIHDRVLLSKLQKGAEKMQCLSNQQYWIKRTLDIIGYKNEA